jgi:hypothetical protein
MAEFEHVDLDLSQIIMDVDLQPRERLDQGRIDQYAEDMVAGATFPPVRVFRVTDRNDRYYLTSGFHRYHGAQEAGRGVIGVEVFIGTFDEAKWDAAASNQEWDRSTEGKKRLEGDKRLAAKMAIQAMQSKSDREIARHVGIGHALVSEVRNGLSVHDGQMSPTRIVNRNGQTYEMDTSRIGRTSPTDLAGDDGSDDVEFATPARPRVDIAGIPGIPDPAATGLPSSPVPARSGLTTRRSATSTGNLKAPFPYFGGKSRVASLIWDHLGDVDNYVEPFCGSAAVLLARPTAPRVETINDADCYVSNFWRATGRDPEAVAVHADWPVNEADLHARHRWLVLSDEARASREKMRSDPDYYDAKVAGWWCWGACCWIGSGWCVVGDDVDEKRPQLCVGNTSHGPGVRRKVPDKMPRLVGGRRGDEYYGGIGVHAEEHLAFSDGHRPQLADAYARGRGVHGNDSAEACAARREWLIRWFGELRDRLRVVRVCCGDWRRVCGSVSVTTRLGLTGIFFDPPYSAEADRCGSLYGVDSATVAHDVRAYCLEHGGDPKMRIVLCGYAGEGHEELVEKAGWTVLPWRASGGYGNRSAKGKENAARERLWFSPHCINPEKE